MMCEGKEERPRYQGSINNSSHGNGGDTLENIEEAISFWRRLWESSGTGNKDAGWLQELKEAIAERVPPPTEEAWQLEPSEAVKVFHKKRNWSASGPDRLVNYWWKRAHALHEGITQVFVSITKLTKLHPLWFSKGKTRLIPKPGDFSSKNQRPIT